jgi:hypothetical protein
LLSELQFAVSAPSVAPKRKAWRPDGGDTGLSPLILLFTALVANMVPIWRAANVDPIRALHNE